MFKHRVVECLVFLALIVCGTGIPLLSAKNASKATFNSRVHPNQAWQTETEKRLSLIETTLSSIRNEVAKSTDVDTHLSKIEGNTNDLKESGWAKTAMPAIISAISLLAGLWIGNYFTGKLQKERLAQEATLAREDAKLEIGSAVIDWELKQLSLLYGPMRALLGQSMALYRQMNTVLSESQKETFRFVPSASSPDGRMLEMQTSTGKWERFRTVLHLSKIYGHGLGIDSYFDEIVSIGRRMVKIIEEQAGYARSEESELMTVFAKYLAHFAVLKHIHQEAQKARDGATPEDGVATQGPEQPAMTVDLSAVFPEEIHKLINQGFEALTSGVREWRKTAVS